MSWINRVASHKRMNDLGIVDLCNSDEEDEQLQDALAASFNTQSLASARASLGRARQRRGLATGRFFNSAATAIISAQSTIFIESDDDSPTKRKRHNVRFTGSPISMQISKEVEILDLMDDRKMPSFSHDTESIRVTEFVQMPILQLYEVFPDVDENHAKSLLMQNNDDVTTVLSILADRSYPKAKMTCSTYRYGVTVPKGGTSTPVWRYDYMSPSSFQPTILYRKEAATQLLCDFPFLTKAGAAHFMKTTEHYAISHDRICSVVTGQGSVVPRDDESQYMEYTALMHVLSVGLLDTGQATNFQSLSVKKIIVKTKKIRSPEFILTDPTLLEEVKFVQHKWETLAKRMEQYKYRMDMRDAAEQSNSTMDCLCCYSSVAIDEMIQCQKEGHLFCIDCIRRLAETELFGNGSLGINRETKEAASELMCMFSDGCSSGFGTASLQKALPEKTLNKYNEIQFQAAIDKAGLDDLVTCPKCDFQALLPPTEMIFRCPIRECLLESCRKCREQSHIPLRCEEVEKLNETAGRVKVEEAISAAKIRTCPRPKCGKKFVKEYGCNKMTCPCGVWVCYVCRQEIAQSVGYSHFCRIPHCSHKSCNACALNSSTNEDDEQAMRDAGRKAAEEFHDATLVQPQTNSELPVYIDVNKIMQQPSTQRPLVHARARNAQFDRLFVRREREVHTQFQARQTATIQDANAQAHRAARFQEAVEVHRTQWQARETARWREATNRRTMDSFAIATPAREATQLRKAAVHRAKVAFANITQAREATQLWEAAVTNTSTIAPQPREEARLRDTTDNKLSRFHLL